MLAKITLLYAGILGLLLVVLSFNVLQNWVRVTGSGRETDRGMRRAERLLSSFVEFVPLGLILMFLIESRGTPGYVVHGLGVCLVISRLIHAVGSNEMAGANLLRFLGTQITYLVITVASLACIYFYSMGTMAIYLPG